MKLRVKLLVPILGSLFVCFFGAYIFVDLVQTAKMKADFASKTEAMTEYFATSNAAYVWNIDIAGLQTSLSSFLKDREVVRIEIVDPRATTCARSRNRPFRARWQ